MSYVPVIFFRAMDIRTTRKLATCFKEVTIELMCRLCLLACLTFTLCSFVVLNRCSDPHGCHALHLVYLAEWREYFAPPAAGSLRLQVSDVAKCNFPLCYEHCCVIRVFLVMSSSEGVFLHLPSAGFLELLLSTIAYPFL